MSHHLELNRRDAKQGDLVIMLGSLDLSREPKGGKAQLTLHPSRLNVDNWWVYQHAKTAAEKTWFCGSGWESLRVPVTAELRALLQLAAASAGRELGVASPTCLVRVGARAKNFNHRRLRVEHVMFRPSVSAVHGSDVRLRGATPNFLTLDDLVVRP